ncbi:hypothetical protein [Dyella sp. C11]|uniref:hypothetical protein n=1 Tax=Dyella sp. C11 TaxID=2126991 RepID=UPI000D6417FD|nr:hypothetical protein [Dyella sp. C11]
MKKVWAFAALGISVGLLAAPAVAQERVALAISAASYDNLSAASPSTEPTYREPLDDVTRARDESAAESGERTRLPVFEVSGTRGQRFSHEALALVGRAMVAAASEKTGVGTPVASPLYQPYRPGMSVPEPSTTELSCPPLGTPSAPARCNTH